jgi:hypothetical protein
MFCPGCGIKEEQLLQYCRGCGTDLRAVRNGLERSDLDVASAAAAREEIARAIAEKIKSGQWWQVFSFVPEVEKLFESPQERNLRRVREAEAQRLKLVRAGVITSATGLGSMLLFLIAAAFANKQVLLLLGPSAVVLLIGLGILINGIYFSVSKRLPQTVPMDGNPPESLGSSLSELRKLTRGGTNPIPPSVTENTTRHLTSEFVRTPSGNLL